MSDEKNKKCYSVTTLNANSKRAGGARNLRIQDARNTWVIGVEKKYDIIKFVINGLNKYKFSLTSDGVIIGEKAVINRPSDSGILSCHEGRFNVMGDDNIRRTIRLINLGRYLLEIFDEKEK